MATATMNSMMNKWKMTLTNEQVLTTFDWEFEIDYSSSNPIMLQPPKDTVFARTTGIQGVMPIPEHQTIQVPMRGFTIIQPGLTVTTPGPVSFNIQDFEDQTLTTWLWDWVNKMNSLATLASYRREQLFCNITIWQLNSSRARVWEYKYYNCLPMPGFQPNFDSQKENNQSGQIQWQAEYYIPRPLNVPGQNNATT